MQVQLCISQVPGESWLEVDGERMDAHGLDMAGVGAPCPKRLTIGFETDGTVTLESENLFPEAG